MTKDEFEERIGQEVAQVQWEIIHTVYQFHPSIDDVQGKDQITQLYKNYGMTIIEDMMYRAAKIADAKERQQILKKQIWDLHQEFQDLENEITKWSPPEQ